MKTKLCIWLFNRDTRREEAYECEADLYIGETFEGAARRTRLILHLKRPDREEEMRVDLSSYAVMCILDDEARRFRAIDNNDDLTDTKI
jgi:hypothetical protein